MTNNVWIFGDSFVNAYKCKKNWADIVANKLGYNSENKSESGCSNVAIALSVIDAVNKINPKYDKVVVCWSTIYRYIDLKTQEENFTTWSESSKDKITDRDSAIEKMTSSISEFLEFSIIHNYILMLLKEKNIDFKFFMGHNEINDASASMQIFPHTQYRIIHPNILKYFNFSNTVTFNTTSSILHEFYAMQYEYANLHTGKLQEINKIISAKVDYSVFTANYFKWLNNNNVCLMVDAWHLNDLGHELFADRIFYLFNNWLLTA